MSIQNLSKLLSGLCILGLLFFPAMWLFFLINQELYMQLAQQNIELDIQWETVTSTQGYIFWGMNVLPNLVIVWGLLNLRRLFNAFARLDFFTDMNIRYLKHFSFSLLASALLKIIVNIVSSVVLSINHPPTEKILSIQFNSHELNTFMIGLIFWLVAKILTEARALATENQQFI